MDRDDARDLLLRMWTIRAFEETASELYARGRIGGLLHLGIGQEAVAVGASSPLRTDDLLFGSHRAHAHALAKGADPERLMAELAGRATGYCAGLGGSMHIAAPETGFVTATGIVAGNIALALGAAWALQQAGEGGVAVVSFGDGAGQAGPFHESLNIAALWGLPLVLLCENNGYAEFTPLSAHTNVEHIAVHARTYGIPASTIDGNDILSVRAAVAEAVARARAGRGPTFVEALTYRLRGHYEGDPAKYRELAELGEWRAKDPIARFADACGRDGSLSPADVADAEGAARARIADATERALAAPVANASDVLRHVYAGTAA